MLRAKLNDNIIRYGNLLYVFLLFKMVKIQVTKIN